MIIVRFDGSCKAPNSTNPRAGAGVAIFITDEIGKLIEIERYVWPLPWAKDAQLAEAFASRLAIQRAYLEAQVRGKDWTVVVQGDNANVIGYWQGKRRVMNRLMFDALQQSLDCLLYTSDAADE